MDQLFNSFIDRLCVTVPDRFRYAVLRFTRTRAGWHLCALWAWLRNLVQGFYSNIRTEEEADLFFSESAERLHHTSGYLRERAYRSVSLLLMINESSDRVRFFMSLAAALVACFGVLWKGGTEIRWVTAAFAFQWLSAAMCLGYRPVAAGIHQKYLVGCFLKAFSFACLLAVWFRMYLARGIANNIILQSMMLIFLFFYFALYLAGVAFNRKQPLLLRVTELFLGVIPALATATAVALTVAQFSLSGVSGVAALIRLAGAGSLFVSDRIDVFKKMSSIPLHMSGLLYTAFYTAGIVLVLSAAWIQ